ncbi:MAG: hypothetical protein ACTSO8_07115 [Promethearchaeota archaeon]
MEKHIHINIVVGFQDYFAITLAIISLIMVSFFFPINFYLYILCVTLFLSVFLEKKVQILLIVNSLVFLFTYQFLPLILSNSSVIDYLLLNFSKLADNSFIVFLGLGSFSVILSISIIFNLNLVLKSKQQQYLDYIKTFSEVGFIIIAFTLSILLVQENSFSILSILPSIVVNLSFLAIIYLHFTFIINFYYILFVLIFLCFLTIRKISLMVTPHSKQTKKTNVKRNQNQNELELKKNKSHKVRGV